MRIYNVAMKNVLGQRLRELRLSIHLTQKKLSEYIYVSQNSISCWETSEREPSISDIIRLAEFFVTLTDYLLGKSDIF